MKIKQWFTNIKKTAKPLYYFFCTVLFLICIQTGMNLLNQKSTVWNILGGALIVFTIWLTAYNLLTKNKTQ